MFLPLILAAALAPPVPPPVPEVQPCANFNRMARDPYGFRPSQIDDAERARRDALMNRFWSAVRADPIPLVPCLKSALRLTTRDMWFLFDGAELLNSIDPGLDAKLLMRDGLARVSFEDVDLRTWVELATSLGADGFNTAELGRRWIAYPKAEYIIPEHGAYHVDRGNGAMFIFGAMEERYATPALVELTRGKNAEQKEMATWLLMSQATPEALRALAKVNPEDLSDKAAQSRRALLEHPRLIEPRVAPRTTRAQFLSAFNALLKGDGAPFGRLMESVPDGERDLVAVCKPEDLDLLRRVRRFYIAGTNQHSIEYYNQFTQILMTLVWTPDATKPAAQKPAKKR